MFDKKKYDDYIQEKSKIEAERREIGVRMHDEFNSDAWEGEHAPAKLIKFGLDKTMYEKMGNDVVVLNSLIGAQEAEKPKPKVIGQEKALREVRSRWGRGGERALDEGERKLFLSEATKEQLQEIPVNIDGGYLFDPAMVSPVMADSDPYLPETNTGNIREGSEAAPQTWLGNLIRLHRYAGAVALTCYQFSTDNGNEIHSPQKNSTAEIGKAILGPPKSIGSLAPVSLTGIDWPRVRWRSSDFMPLDLDSLSDLNFDIMGETMMDSAERLARGWNKEFTLGSGIINVVTAGGKQTIGQTAAATSGNTNYPGRCIGIVPSARVVDGGAGSISAIDFANLLDLEYSVDLSYFTSSQGLEAYADRGMEIPAGFMFMFHRNIEKILRGAVDPNSHRPLWLPNLEVGRAAQMFPGLISGKYPYVVNNDMADGAATLDLAMLFGNMSHFAVRNVGPGTPMFFRFQDRMTMESMSIQILGISRRHSRHRGPNVDGVDGNDQKCEALSVLQVKT